MAKFCQLTDIYDSPWGIVEHRRAEIESGAYGTFDRVFAEEVDKAFPAIEQVSLAMECSVSTARRWIEKSDTRFIVVEGKNRYLREDVLALKERRDASKKKAA